MTAADLPQTRPRSAGRAAPDEVTGPSADSHGGVLGEGGDTRTGRPRLPPERPRNRRPSRTLISRSRSEQSSGRAARILNEAIFDGASPCGPLG